jgi:hypothetical protein
MNADPRWLEILKASGWQTTALAIASTVIAILVRNKVIPTDSSPYWFNVPVIAAVILWCLSLAAMGSALTKAADPAARIRRWRHLHRAKRSAREYIPHMTAKEKEIIGYLLHHNQKVFQTDQDGSYAAPLISKGIVVVAVRPGQVVDPLRVPFEIPDHIWSVLQSQRAQFPYVPPKDGEREVHPWAIHWMAR